MNHQKNEPELEPALTRLFTTPDPADAFVSDLQRRLQDVHTDAHTARQPSTIRALWERLRSFSASLAPSEITLASVVLLVGLLAAGVLFLPQQLPRLLPQLLPAAPASGFQPIASPSQGGVPSATPEITPPMLAPGVCQNPAPTLPPLPRVAAPDRLISGGRAVAGNLVFDFWLYCDPNLGSDQTGEKFSEIAGLGLVSTWYYQGKSPVLSTMTHDYWGLEPYIPLNSAFSASLTPGSNAVIARGWTLTPFPDALPGSGDAAWRQKSTLHLSYDRLVQTDAGTHGARFSFTLNRSLDGYTISDSKVTALPFDPRTQEAVSFYTVQAEDNLFSIAARFRVYSVSAVDILKANHTLLSDNPNHLQPGQMLLIPHVETTEPAEKKGISTP